jgi:hypothetical protein
MQRLVRALGIVLVVGAIVIYSRDCRMTFNMWKHCGGDAGQPGFLGDYVKFDWNYQGMLSSVLRVDGKPAARLVKYDFGLNGDTIDIVSLDGAHTSRYCGK